MTTDRQVLGGWSSADGYLHGWHLTRCTVKHTENPADRITVLIDLVKPSFDVSERLHAGDVVDNDYTVSTAVVATQ